MKVEKLNLRFTHATEDFNDEALENNIDFRRTERNDINQNGGTKATDREIPQSESKSLILQN